MPNQLSIYSEEPEEFKKIFEMYIKCMMDIIHRMHLIREVIKQPIEILTRNNDYLMEFFCSQFRIILETLVLSSLVANEKDYIKGQGKISKPWKHHKLLAVLEKINPHFYPVSMNYDIDNKNRRIFLARKESGFLKKNEIIKLHNELSNYSHAKNPFSKNVDNNILKQKIERCYSELSELLGAHIVKFKTLDKGILVAINFEEPFGVEPKFILGNLSEL